jgi:23S rRNA (adenine2030-N6)-methyltransferase
MTNIHYGNIGDIWKHLSLAEILAIEAPSAYWESHAGSSHYALTHSPEREYGIFYFAHTANQSEVLNTAVYTQLLKGYERNGQLRLFPGSPLLAMTVLPPHHATFLFCDTDPQSLSTISDDRATLGHALDAVQVVQGDGIGTLARLLTSVGPLEMSHTFAHLDPYQPFAANADGISTVDVFCELSQRGGKAMLWYGFASVDDQERIHRQLQHTFHAQSFHPPTHRLWCGEMTLNAIHTPGYRFHPGVMGCGIILSNVSNVSQAACKQLGEALETLYASAMLPHHQSGALTFSEHPL